MDGGPDSTAGRLAWADYLHEVGYPAIEKSIDFDDSKIYDGLSFKHGRAGTGSAGRDAWFEADWDGGYYAFGFVQKNLAPGVHRVRVTLLDEPAIARDNHTFVLQAVLSSRPFSEGQACKGTQFSIH